MSAGWNAFKGKRRSLDDLTIDELRKLGLQQAPVVSVASSKQYVGDKEVAGEAVMRFVAEDLGPVMPKGLHLHAEVHHAGSIRRTLAMANQKADGYKMPVAVVKEPGLPAMVAMSYQDFRAVLMWVMGQQLAFQGKSYRGKFDDVMSVQAATERRKRFHDDSLKATDGGIRDPVRRDGEPDLHGPQSELGPLEGPWDADDPGILAPSVSD